MKTKMILMAFLSLSLVFCAQEKHTVKKKKSTSLSPEQLKKVKVVNALDPICQMKTADYLKDTAMYKNKIYGFCSVSCKDQFKKNPAKYVKN